MWWELIISCSASIDVIYRHHLTMFHVLISLKTAMDSIYDKEHMHVQLGVTS